MYTACASHPLSDLLISTVLIGQTDSYYYSHIFVAVKKYLFETSCIYCDTFFFFFFPFSECTLLEMMQISQDHPVNHLSWNHACQPLSVNIIAAWADSCHRALFIRVLWQDRKDMTLADLCTAVLSLFRWLWAAVLGKKKKDTDKWREYYCNLGGVPLSLVSSWSWHWLTVRGWSHWI